MTMLSGLLVTAAVIAAVASTRVHGAYREALRELRDGERRLEPGPGGRRLEDELRWYGDVAGLGRDSGWRVAAGAVAVLVAGGFVVGLWALGSATGLEAASVVVLLAAFVLVLGLLVADGRRAESRLAAAARRFPLGPVRRLEDALVGVHAASARVRAAQRERLRVRTHPLAPVVAASRRRAYGRAARRQDRALAALRRALPVQVAGVAVRIPDGYAEGLRGLSPLVAGGLADDDRWAAAVADLGRAAERDAARRTRWLSALAACAELRDDPAARESAARWALDAAALGEPSPPPGDPLPDAVAIEPTRPSTWEGALRRGRTVGAAPALLAEVTLRWAYSLAVAGHPLDPAVTAAAEVMDSLDPADADRYLTPLRPGLESLGATSPQLSRLVPRWPGPTPPAAAPAAVPAPGPAPDSARTTPPHPPGPTATPGSSRTARPDPSGPTAGPDGARTTPPSSPGPAATPDSPTAPGPTATPRPGGSTAVPPGPTSDPGPGPDVPRPPSRRGPESGATAAPDGSRPPGRPDDPPSLPPRTGPGGDPPIPPPRTPPPDG